MAVRLIEALPEVNRKVARDVSVVNLNGQPFYSTPGLDLTTAVAPYDRMVAKVLEILTQDDGDLNVCHCIFRPRFHAGCTSGPVRTRRT
jgi:DNA-binding LacI/PurR family transcriptional regulator